MQEPPRRGRRALGESRSRAVASAPLGWVAAATVALAGVATVSSCRAKSMQEQYADVRRACRAGDATRARKMTLEMIEASEKFKRLFQDAAADAGGQGIDYCSPFLLVGVEKRIAKADSPD